MPDINVIPDNCMVNILSSLPLIDIIRSSQICNRWVFIHEVVCENVHSLNIRGHHNFSYESLDKLRFFNLQESDFDLVDVRGKVKSARFWQSLVEKFPNVKKLTLFECSINENQLSDLLKSKWSQKLTHLNLISKEDKSWSEDSIWRNIEAMSSLKHFSLHNASTEPVAVPVQVDECFFSLQNFPQDILLALKRFDTQANNDASCRRLQRFGMIITDLDEEYTDENDEDLESAFDEIFNQNLAYAHMLTRLAITECSIDLQVLQLICSKFPSLTYFDFNLEHPVLFDVPVWAALDQLKHLTELGIKADENYQQPVIPINIDTEKLTRFEKLTKGVRLLNCHRIHPHQYGSIEWMFPNASRITIQFSPRYFFDADERYKQMKLCHFCSSCLKLRKALPPNKGCIKYYNPILILLDIKHASIQNIDIQIDPTES